MWKTYKVTSGPEIKKLPAEGGIGEIWGKYPKIYSKMLLGGGTFNPPLYFFIDDVRVLCACRDIPGKLYARKNGNLVGDTALKAKILSGAITPACWEDYHSIMSPHGDNTYDIYVKHPAFYAYTLSNNGSVGLIKNVAEGDYGTALPAAAAGFFAYKILNPKGGKRKSRKRNKKRLSKKLTRKYFTS